jgi:hypothetical protein
MSKEKLSNRGGEKTYNLKNLNSVKILETKLINYYKQNQQLTKC